MLNVGDPQQVKMSFLDVIWKYKILLAVLVVLVSSITFTLLYVFGNVPNELKMVDNTPEESIVATATPVVEATPTPTNLVKNNTVKNTVTTTSTIQTGELPTRVIIDKVGVNINVVNPISTNTEYLFNQLVRGAVRYPGSGTLGVGNMFIFGHSSRLGVVNNKAYRALNNIDKLEVGDIVRIQSATKEYTYSVKTVKMAKDSDIRVDFSNEKSMVTLSTCNVFGAEEERFVVEADYVSVKDL